MIRTLSPEFKKFFFLKLTEELVLHSEEGEIGKLRQIIKEKRKIKKKIPLKERILLKEKYPGIRKLIYPKPQIPIPQKPFAPQKKVSLNVQKAQQPVQIKPVQIQQRSRPIQVHPLRIPEPKLPKHLEYLRPVPTANKTQIDLGKLNPLLRDPAVRIIEVNQDEKITVAGTMGKKPTGIIMSKEDIDNVIRKISEISKIPADEGVYRVVVDNLIFSAIISEVVGSKFIIKKLLYSPKKDQTIPTSLANSFRR